MHRQRDHRDADQQDRRQVQPDPLVSETDFYGARRCELRVHFLLTIPAVSTVNIAIIPHFLVFLVGVEAVDRAPFVGLADASGTQLARTGAANRPNL